MSTLAASDFENRQTSVLATFALSPEAFIQADMFDKEFSIEILSSPMSLFVLMM